MAYWVFRFVSLLNLSLGWVGRLDGLNVHSTFLRDTGESELHFEFKLVHLPKTENGKTKLREGFFFKY